MGASWQQQFETIKQKSNESILEYLTHARTALEFYMKDQPLNKIAADGYIYIIRGITS